MPMVRYFFFAALVCFVASLTGKAADQASRVVVYDGVATTIAAASEVSNDLWVTMKDLTRATHFVVKPQGVCRDQLCFPLPKARRGEFISKKGALTFFNLSEFARLIKQPAAKDDKNGVWYFGP